MTRCDPRLKIAFGAGGRPTRFTTSHTFRSSTHCLRFNKPSPSDTASRTQRVARWFHRVRETSISSLRAIVIGGPPLEDPTNVQKNSSGVKRENRQRHICCSWHAGRGGTPDLAGSAIAGIRGKLEPLRYKGDNALHNARPAGDGWRRFACPFSSGGSDRARSRRVRPRSRRRPLHSPKGRTGLWLERSPADRLVSRTRATGGELVDHAQW